jgi:hypothetical protein
VASCCLSCSTNSASEEEVEAAEGFEVRLTMNHVVAEVSCGKQAFYAVFMRLSVHS